MTTTAAITAAKSILNKRNEIAKLHVQPKSKVQTSHHRKTHPFLTWAWLSSDFDKSIGPERVAAENLFAIMEDIDTNLKRRKEISYIHAMESTLPELEARVSGSRLEMPSRNAAHPADTSLGSKDALLRIQKSAIHDAIDELSINAKKFVSLFIPSSYQHAVSKKIWGSLSLLTKSATSDFEDSERSKQTYIIRPLETEFMKKHKISRPFFPLLDCSACKEGHVHRSAQDAVFHLKRVHFRYEPSLSQLKHLQTTYRYFVRTENDVRNELANNKQLGLLRICLNYLKILVARAEKIHLGIVHEGQADLAKYQLPNDLVDCFEATALFLMQSATSVMIIEDDMRRWQHVPGNLIEEVKTPAIQYTLDRLGELGQAAQASMTKAEKTLALSGLETNSISTGTAGPELLIILLTQNLQMKPLLEDVDMDVNQLYQEYMSKLQYQVNQFPRKRLLRDINALQEELMVVQSVNKWQQQSFESLLKVLDPQSFKSPASGRVSMFPPESECLNEGLKTLRSKATELRALEDRTQYLQQQLKQSVEILEEDNGKAIMVFTLITTIFLPLSFVTSFFGMNTVDIRNTSQSQGSFWAIAVPVTLGIVFAVLLLAYHGDKLYDGIVQTVHRLREQRTRNRAKLAPLKSKRTWQKALPLHPRYWGVRGRSGFRRFDTEKLRLP
ncbi:hypothetical protein EJ02DRAFT_412440 [Clathrospora elynae]|uniref:DUF7896 domain-containing protein n=1 Tax=Clathrospora elynae TaxID=706981 RepID=A0A6A5S9Z4_9PLEO|nr:hypothetical protein EJ02DRAFT_412440 [Clathrospora elynae]